MQKKTWRILTILVIVALAVATIAKFKLNYGLDIKGGSHVVLEAQPTKGVEINAETMDKAKSVIERRVNGLGVSEPLVQRQGERRIIVELPGIKEREKAIAALGKMAKLEFRDPEGKTQLTGADLKDARATYGDMSGPVVSLEFSAEGAKKFARLTSEHVNENVPIYLDGQVISNPVVKTPITNGKAVIEGMRSIDEAKELAVLLKAGALPVTLVPKEVRSVSPLLEKESINRSLQAGLVGLALVLLFMALIYRVPGLLANLALVIYALVTLALMSGLHATLTLPGIAGIVLSIGMAVDANIIIFERIKDELRGGKKIRAAVEAGFHRAFACILDSNLTTIIAAIILFYLGTGPVKGFAVTLTLGVLVSMLTAIILTRWMLDAAVDASPDGMARSFRVKEGLADA